MGLSKNLRIHLRDDRGTLCGYVARRADRCHVTSEPTEVSCGRCRRYLQTGRRPRSANGTVTVGIDLGVNQLAAAHEATDYRHITNRDLFSAVVADHLDRVEAALRAAHITAPGRKQRPFCLDAVTWARLQRLAADLDVSAAALLRCCLGAAIAAG